MFCQQRVNTDLHYVTTEDMGKMFLSLKVPSRNDDIRARFAFIHDQKDAFAQNMKYHLNCLRKETRHTQKKATLMAVMKEKRLQTTQPTSGGAVTVVSSCCANCVEPPRPQQWGPDLPFFGHAGHADPLDGWRCCSQKRVMSRPIQVRQL